LTGPRTPNPLAAAINVTLLTWKTAQ